jgi:putative oxidoreductase
MLGIKKVFATLGRMLLSLIFILSALNKIFDWSKTEAGIINLFSDWQSYISGSDFFSRMFSELITWAPEILIGVTIVELVGSLLVFFGIKEKFGAFLLILFFIPATILLHPFWFFTSLKRSAQVVMFLKNLAMIGGLFILMVFGSKLGFSKPKANDDE